MTYIRGTRRPRPALHVSHAPEDAVGVALLVDFFEASVAGLEGLITCGSLPGYAPSAPPDLSGALLLGVFQGPAVPARVVDEVTTLAAEADRTVLVSLGAGPCAEPPARLAAIPLLRLHDAVLSRLSDELGELVARRFRDSEAAAEAREELMLRAYSEPREAAAPALQARKARLPAAPLRVFPPPAEPVSDTPSSDAVAPGGGPQRISTLVPKPRRPSALLSVSAGANLADAAARGVIGEADLVVLDGEFAEFLHGLGGDWFQLRATVDAGAVVASVDSLLDAAPERLRASGAWYRAGFQLSVFCGLCSRGGVPAVATADRSWIAQARGRAWNAFWGATGALSLPEHSVTALSALLEDVDAPGGPRVETVQCLEVLRNAAHDRDCEDRNAAAGPHSWVAVDARDCG